MVRCLNCMGQLPMKCKCNKTSEEKITEWIKQAEREAKLINEIIYNSLKPKIDVQLITVDKKTKEATLTTIPAKTSTEAKSSYTANVHVFFTIPEPIHGIVVTLYGADDQPLYKRMYITKFKPRDTFDVTWRLGFQEEE